MNSLEQLINLKTNLLLKRKFKIILSFFLVGILIVGAIAAWVGVVAYKNIASIGANPVVQEKIRSWNNLNIQEKAGSVEKVTGSVQDVVKVDCLTTAKNLIKTEIWITKPLVENVNSLKIACLNK